MLFSNWKWPTFYIGDDGLCMVWCPEHVRWEPCDGRAIDTTYKGSRWPWWDLDEKRVTPQSKETTDG